MPTGFYFVVETRRTLAGHSDPESNIHLKMNLIESYDLATYGLMNIIVLLLHVDKYLYSASAEDNTITGFLVNPANNFFNFDIYYTN